MSKKTSILGILMIFGILLSNISYAGSSFFSSGFDISIDRVIVNNQVVGQSKSNLLDDSDTFFLSVDVTAVQDLQAGHVEAVLRGKQSGNVVADSTGIFDLFAGESTTAFLTLRLTDGLTRENDYDLTVKVVNARGSSEQKTYGIKTKRSTSVRGALDVSIDRVKVNSRVVASSTSNFIDENDNFDVSVEFTALESVENARVEAVLKDLDSGSVVADASPNFNLAKDSSASKLLRLELLDKLKRSGSFELAVKIVDTEGNAVKQVYGIRMKGENIASSNLDISVDSVEVENRVLAVEENNFVLIGESKKDIDLRVKFTALENIKGARIDAILSFANGDVVADTTSTFNASKDEQVTQSLRLNLVSKFKQNDFTLKVIVKDSDGNFVEKTYDLRISEQKFPFFVSNIKLNPEESVQAGKSLSVTLVIKHSGVVQLDGITAKASIPYLDLSSTKLLSGKDSNSEEIEQEFILKIPDNVEPGTYRLRAEIANQFDNNKESREIMFSVKGKPEQVNEVIDGFSINAPIGKQNMKNDGSEVTYPITLTNNGDNTKSFSIVLDGWGWADLRLSEASAFVLKPQESKTVNVFASTQTKESGEKTFFVAVKSNDQVTRQIPLKANIIPVTVFSFMALSLKGLLEALLILTLIALVAVGMIYGTREFSRKGDKEQSEADKIPNSSQGEAYY